MSIFRRIANVTVDPHAELATAFALMIGRQGLTTSTESQEWTWPELGGKEYQVPVRSTVTLGQSCGGFSQGRATSRTVDCTQAESSASHRGRRYPLLERILRYYGIRFRCGGHRNYEISGRDNLEKLRSLDISSLHKEKDRRFLRMMSDYRQGHYTRGSLPELVHQKTASATTTRELAALPERSTSRIYQALLLLRLEGRLQMYRVHSRYYWVRSDANTIVILPEKQQILRLLGKPARINEIAEALSRRERSVSKRLHELENLALAARENSKWTRLHTKRKVIAR